MARSLTLLSVLLLASCAVSPDRQTADVLPLLHDDAFVGHDATRVESREEVFALGQDAKDFLNRFVIPVKDYRSRGRTLIGELFNQAQLNLSYQSNANTTASQTFRNRSANCLSLSILAYSMAKYAGFHVSFQEVSIPDYWERRGNYSLMSRHVNLLMRSNPDPEMTITLRDVQFMVDFQPMPGFRYPPRRLIDEERALAMFYNNKAVDALLADDPVRAYAYLRSALLTDPSLDMAQANLALLYANEGHLDHAEASFLSALEIDPENHVAADGYATLLRRTGRDAEADVILARVERARNDNPWFVYIQGEEAYDAGRWEEAIDFYRNALRLDDEVDSFHFGLARAYLEVGRTDLAQLHLEKAKRFAGYDDLKEKYQSKLVALSNLH